MRLPRETFEQLVAEAIEGLPDEFADKLDNVEFIIENHPSPDDYDERGVEPGSVLLGLYHGVPLTERSPFSPTMMPDEITIFQRPLEQVCRTPEEIIYQVRRTVLHEIAHHFGISDERLEELGYG
ncbi:MAG: metallopeptidase family protein [Armatimonadota bacterium]|nr:MAG: metallopeptidase family protein [Armatimonadota bacterium]